MKLNLFSRPILLTALILGINPYLHASGHQVIFQVPVQIDYSDSEISPLVSCDVNSSDGTMQGFGKIGGLPHLRFQKTVNVVVKAFSGKRLTKGMKYHCNLTPVYVRSNGSGLANSARRAQQSDAATNRVKRKAKRAVLELNGTL